MLSTTKWGTVSGVASSVQGVSIESLRPVEGSGDGQDLTVRSENLSTPVPQPDVGVPVVRVRRRRWRVGTLVAAAALLLVGLVWFAGSRIESPAARAAKAAPPVPSVVTADVERRVLSESLVTRGDVKPSGSPRSCGLLAAGRVGCLW